MPPAASFDVTSRIGNAKTTHHLAATPDTCFWGYIDPDVPAVLEVDPGDIIEIEAITHHAGDAPDLMMDDGIRALWSAIPEAERGPGVHVMTGPIAVRGAEPGSTGAHTASAITSTRRCAWRPRRCCGC